MTRHIFSRVNLSTDISRRFVESQKWKNSVLAHGFSLSLKLPGSVAGGCQSISWTWTLMDVPTLGLVWLWPEVGASNCSIPGVPQRSVATSLGTLIGHRDAKTPSRWLMPNLNDLIQQVVSSNPSSGKDFFLEGPAVRCQVTALIPVELS